MHQVRDLFLTDRRLQHQPASQPAKAFPYSHLSTLQDCRRRSEITEWERQDVYAMSLFQT